MRILALLGIFAASCTGPVADNADADLTSTASVAPPPPTALATDLCDDPTYADVAWSSASSAHIAVYYLAGTAADADHAAILARLEHAYASIRATLAIDAEPTVSVYLSPSRVAAAAHGRGFGRAFPGEDREEVIYTGAPDSYEVLRYGHELSDVLAYYADPGVKDRAAVLREGLAESLDQSGRDLHEAYAQQLLAGTETRVRVTGFDDRDLSGRNYGRAGSLVAFLVDRYGMARFLDLLRATQDAWSPDELTAMLDGALTATVGEGWAAIEPAWRAEVQGALERADVRMPDADRAEIEHLFSVQDLAISSDDPALYRSTLEGFYCEWGGETMRVDVSARVVAAYTSSTSRVEAIVPTGVKNFRTAQVTLRRTDARGLDSFVAVTLEHVPAGWRVAYGPDWY